MADMDYEKEPQVMILEPRVKPGYLTTEVGGPGGVGPGGGV